MLPNAAIIENYKCNIEDRHEFQIFSEKCNGNAISQPLEVTFAKTNIGRAQTAILDGCRYDNSNSIYQEMRGPPFCLLDHGNLSKFNREYSGIMISGIDSSLNLLNVPYALPQMKGGFTAFDTANDLLSFILFKHIRNNAYESIKSHFAKTDRLNFQFPPTYFKIRTLSEIKEDKKEINITLDTCMPVANTGDSVVVSKKH